MSGSPAAHLRQALGQGPMLVAPGAYDGLTARLVEQAGFPVVYMTGAGTAAAHGYPDYGLLSMTEMTANAARMVAAVRIPLIADADTGYGNELNVVRTVEAFHRAGVAAIHLEDQTFPKRCGHLDRKEVVDAGEFTRKIAAACRYRPDPAMVIIARTDARAVLGFDEAVERANRALAAGADMAFVEAPQTLDEVAAVPQLVEGPCLFNLVPRGNTPPVSLDDLERWGYRLVIAPAILMTSVVRVAQEALHGLGDRSTPAAGGAMGIAEFFRHAGSEQWDDVRSHAGYLAPPVP